MRESRARFTQFPLQTVKKSKPAYKRHSDVGTSLVRLAKPRARHHEPRAYLAQGQSLLQAIWGFLTLRQRHTPFMASGLSIVRSSLHAGS